MKCFSVNRGKIKWYVILAVLLYVLIAVAYYMRGLDGFPTAMLPSLLIMPVAIFIIGITEVKINSKWVRLAIAVLLFLYIPAHIINFVLGDYEINLAESFFYNCLMVFALMCALMAIFFNLKAAAVICCSLAFIILCVNTLVTAFRGTAVTPADLYAIATASKVAGRYKYFVDLAMVSSVMYFIILIQLINKLNINLKSANIWCKLALRFVFVLLAVVSCASGINHAAPLAMSQYNAFDTTLSNRKMGTILVFIMNVRNGRLDMPENYNKQTAEQILADTSVADKIVPAVEKPNIIVIMNEAFCDIGGIYKVGESEDPLKYWHSLQENTISGDMLVSINGGGTSYTEFEFLTGISGGIIPIAKTPYLDCIKSDTASLAWDLKEQGYTNIAVHPFWSSCWNRGIVYPFLGFDDFISGEDFSDKEKSAKDYNSISDEHIITHTDFGDDLEYIRDYMSDRQSYKKVIEQFENKSKDEKLFVFNVTVQNHSGFDYEGEDFEEDVFSSKYDNKPTNQYLSLLKQSDIAYGELIEYFKNYDEPTIILMFGDHQPGIALATAPTEESTQDSYKVYCKNNLEGFIVPYKLWANYDIPEQQPSITSAGFLSLILKDTAGIDYNSWDNFRKNMRDNFDGINSQGYWIDNATKKYTGGDETRDELIKKYEMLEYYLLKDNAIADEAN